jgi:hypothetical protein
MIWPRSFLPGAVRDFPVDPRPWRFGRITSYPCDFGSSSGIPTHTSTLWGARPIENARARIWRTFAADGPLD